MSHLIFLVSDSVLFQLRGGGRSPGRHLLHVTRGPPERIRQPQRARPRDPYALQGEGYQDRGGVFHRVQLVPGVCNVNEFSKLFSKCPPKVAMFWKNNQCHHHSSSHQVCLDDFGLCALRSPHGLEVHRRQSQAAPEKVLGDIEVGLGHAF